MAESIENKRSHVSGGTINLNINPYVILNLVQNLVMLRPKNEFKVTLKLKINPYVIMNLF